jgi:hypothetical protein
MNIQRRRTTPDAHGVPAGGHDWGGISPDEGPHQPGAAKSDRVEGKRRRRIELRGDSACPEYVRGRRTGGIIPDAIRPAIARLADGDGW